jgi:hypothetical protein
LWQKKIKVPNGRRSCYPEPMKFVEPSHFADPDTAVRKLVQIANAFEVVQDGRISSS